MRTIIILCASLLPAVFWITVLSTCGSGSDDDDDEAVIDDDTAEDDDLDDDG